MARILLFTENFVKGGLDAFLVQLINHWPNKEDEIYLYSNKDHPGNETLKNQITRACHFIYYRAYISRHVFSMLEKLKSPKFIARIFRFFSHYLLLPFQIFHCRHLLKNKNLDKAMIVNGGYPGGEYCIAMSIAWGFFTGKKSIHNFHAHAVSYRPITKPIDWFIDILVRKNTSSFISVSKNCIYSILVRGHGFKDSNVKYIYNGISKEVPVIDDTICLKQKLKIDKDQKIILMLGVYLPSKGHEFLFRSFNLAASICSNIALVTFGSDPIEYRKSLESSKKILTYGNKIYLGGFHEHIELLIEQSDIIVMPSQSFESFGLVIIEAMRQKKPVIVTRVGGMPEVVGKEGAGYVVAPDDVEGFANAMTVLATNSVVYEKMALKGYERFNQLFIADKMSQSYCSMM